MERNKRIPADDVISIIIDSLLQGGGILPLQPRKTTIETTGGGQRSKKLITRSTRPVLRFSKKVCLSLGKVAIPTGKGGEKEKRGRFEVRKI